MITSRKKSEPEIVSSKEIDAIETAAIAGKALSEPVETAPLGPELLDQAAAEPTLNRFLDRSPKVGEPINYSEMVSLLQKKRQMFITAEAKRKSGDKTEEE